MSSHRLAAVVSLLLLAVSLVGLAVTAVTSFPRGLLAVVLVLVAVVAGLEALRCRGARRVIWLVACALFLVAALTVMISGDHHLVGIGSIVLLVLSVGVARRAFRNHTTLPAATPPSRPIVVWNPKSGGGKAVTHQLADQARKRGFEPIELKPGDDLVQLVRDAVERGADGLAAAGGDGTQALVATIAAEHDLPFACIPAGTRNHFALDLGVDRDDVVGALDAFVDGGERRVDLAEVNGRVFVNNVSLGLYAEAVQRPGYRESKLRTLLDTAPDVLGPASGDSTSELHWRDQDGESHDSAAVILVSNNPYRLGRVMGSGTRPRMDGGVLGVAAMQAPPGGQRQWSTPTFEVDSPRPIPVGVDGEALVLDAPLQFASRPAALRVRIAPQHPGASPSATLPEHPVQVIGRLLAVAAGRA